MKRKISKDLLSLICDEYELGLNASKVEESRKRWGKNDIVGELKKKRWQFAVDALRDPMIWFLVAVSIAYIFLGQATESLVLLLAIIPIIGMDAYLHRRTNVTTSSLATRLATRATVIRDGKRFEISSTDVVVGDTAIIASGDYFPADGILVDGEGIQVDESSLSGESYPVIKTTCQIPSQLEGDDLKLADSQSVYAGTRLLTESGTIIVTHVGKDTLYGEIISLLRIDAKENTPLQIAIHSLVLALLGAAVAVCAVLAIVRLAQGFGWIDAFLSSATLAVAALPEEFPIVYTFFLGVGVYRMAKRKVLVRRAVAVENIGRITCICTDKTGTLTEGALRLRETLPFAGGIEDLLFHASMASNSTNPDPVDQAILEKSQLISKNWKLVARFPFTEDRKRESVVVRNESDTRVVMKGAPEEVMKRVLCTKSDAIEITNQIEQLAAKGLKVIACAFQKFSLNEWNGAEPEHGFTFAGLLAFEDPPRPEVKDAIQWCKSEGIRVVMITGDHQKTAEGIAVEIGLASANEVKSLNAETCEDLEEATYDCQFNIVARATPSQKLNVVRSLKESGEIVAVTGDGVNDAPALQIADISIAMGERGTQSAREVSSIILIDDNFASIVNAIGEGRQLFANLQKSFQYLLTIHLPLVLTAMLIPLAGYPVLYEPIHIVWLEMIIHPTALLVFQELPKAKVVPRYNVESGRFFSKSQWLAIVFCGVLIATIITATYHRSLGPMREDVFHARSMALLVLVFASGMLTAGLSGLKTWTSRVVTFGTLMSAFIFLEIPFFANVFKVNSLHYDDFLIASFCGAVIGLFASLMGRQQYRKSVKA